MGNKKLRKELEILKEEYAAARARYMSLENRVIILDGILDVELIDLMRNGLKPLEDSIQLLEISIKCIEAELHLWSKKYMTP